MCGITGILNRDNSDNLNNLREMSKIIQSRGPDSHGEWINDKKTVYIGHRRLAIQDLSKAGHQPMISSCGRYVLVFNGELYNFKEIRNLLKHSGYDFKGESDTEVFLGAFINWGFKKALKKFTGMFAIAIYDQKLEKLYCARDRLGEKPFYYFNDRTTFAFSSELKSFNNISFYKKLVNKSYIKEYFQRGYSHGKFTLYKNILRLEPGKIIEYDYSNNTIRHDTYWDIDALYENSTNKKFIGTFEQATDKLDRLLKNVISNQLISDAPLGCFLSGGIDSSLVTAISSKGLNKKLDTFSIGFENPKYNEIDHAKRVSSYLGTNHHDLILREDNCLELVQKLPNIYDEPFFDVSAIPTLLLSEFTSKHVKVALSGDGGDELFWGYNRYSRASKLWDIYKYSPFTPNSAFNFQNALSFITSSKINKINRSLYMLGSESIFGMYRRMQHIFTDYEISKILNINYVSKEPIHEEFSFIPFHDIKSYMCDDILVKVDRASMSKSLETRAPFLDHNIVNFSFSLPADMKIKGTNQKAILKNLLGKYMPKNFFNRPKQGFSVPLEIWLRSSLKSWCYQIIEKAEKENTLELNYKYIWKMWDIHQSHKSDLSSKLWAIILLLQFELNIDS